jgi:hypothetical protein
MERLREMGARHFVDAMRTALLFLAEEAAGEPAEMQVEAVVAVDALSLGGLRKCTHDGANVRLPGFREVVVARAVAAALFHVAALAEHEKWAGAFLVR